MPNYDVGFSFAYNENILVRMSSKGLQLTVHS